MTNYHATSEGNVPFTDEEEAQWAVEQAAWTANANNRKAVEVRAERDAKLAATDWTQIADATANKATWANYRQALRDISGQASFPWSVTWPDAP